MPYVRGTSVDFGRDVLWLWQQAGTLQPTNLRVPSQVVSGRIIPNEPREIGLMHRLETEVLIPAFTPNWNTNVPVSHIDSTRFYPRFSNLPPRKGATIDFTIMRGSAMAAAAGEREFTITHNLNDATQVVLVSCNWNTTVARESKGATSMVVRTAIEAPADGTGLIYWSPQSDDTDIYEDGEAVAAGSREHVIVHNSGYVSLPMFFLPSWQTTIWFRSRLADQTTVRFSSPAPAGGGLLDWRIKQTTVI